MVFGNNSGVIVTRKELHAVSFWILFIVITMQFAMMDDYISIFFYLQLHS